eukprot:scaffold304_cov248-Pinguiococcus_pyrenoidosus.AAC.13
MVKDVKLDLIIRIGCGRKATVHQQIDISALTVAHLHLLPGRKSPHRRRLETPRRGIKPRGHPPRGVIAQVPHRNEHQGQIVSPSGWDLVLPRQDRGKGPQEEAQAKTFWIREASPLGVGDVVIRLRGKNPDGLDVVAQRRQQPPP